MVHPFTPHLTLALTLYIGLFDLGFSWVEIGSVTPKPQVRFEVLSFTAMS